jgi:hypothetical protein
MSNIFCEFCNKSFCSISTLNRHQITNKTCLKKQNKPIVIYECEYCKKKFNFNSFSKHENICEEKNNFIIILKKENELLKKENDELKKQIVDLRFYEKTSADYKECLLKMSEKSKNVTINGNITKNNIVNLNVYNKSVLEEKIKKVLQQEMNEAIVCEGQKGIARILAPHLKESNMIKCVDKSRYLFEMLLEENKKNKDNCKLLVNDLIHPLSYNEAKQIFAKDKEGRKQSYNLFEEKENLKKLKTELQIFETELQRKKKNSVDYEEHEQHINEIKCEIQEKIKIITYLENKNVIENSDPESLINYELCYGLQNINKLKTDCTEFSKDLTTHF